MKRLLLIAALLSFSSPAFASDIMLDDVHAFETSEGMKNGAALLTLMNHGPENDKLIEASTPAATKTEIHEMSETNGIMKMREVGAVAIEAGKTVTFSPEGYHLMLMGLKEPLKTGAAYPLTLKFLKAGELKTTFKVVSRSAKPATSSHEGHH